MRFSNVCAVPTCNFTNNTPETQEEIYEVRYTVAGKSLINSFFKGIGLLRKNIDNPCFVTHDLVFEQVQYLLGII